MTINIQWVTWSQKKHFKDKNHRESYNLNVRFNSTIVFSLFYVFFWCILVWPQTYFAHSALLAYSFVNTSQLESFIIVKIEVDQRTVSPHFLTVNIILKNTEKKFHITKSSSVWPSPAASIIRGHPQVGSDIEYCFLIGQTLPVDSRRLRLRLDIYLNVNLLLKMIRFSLKENGCHCTLKLTDGFLCLKR